MDDMRKSDKGSGDLPDDKQSSHPAADAGRRQMLDLLKKAAIAAPVVMTLKASPARAGSNISNHS